MTSSTNKSTYCVEVHLIFWNEYLDAMPHILQTKQFSVTWEPKFKIGKHKMFFQRENAQTSWAQKDENKMIENRVCFVSNNFGFIKIHFFSKIAFIFRLKKLSHPWEAEHFFTPIWPTTINEEELFASFLNSYIINTLGLRSIWTLWKWSKITLISWA